jgi:proline dehydrogenase
MGLGRHLLLAASKNRWLRARAARSAVVRRSVSAFMPGEEIDDAVQAALGLRPLGIGAIFTRLGENITHAGAADAVTRHYLAVLDAIHVAGLRAPISIKPTQLGLDVDAELCFSNLERLVRRATERDSFVWIDMESSAYVDRTLALFRRARAASDKVGVALQAYLHRTDADVASLLPLRPTLRLVKGAYLEPPSVALARKTDVDDRFHTLAVRVLDEAASSRAFLQVATHDRRLVQRLDEFIDRRGIPAAAYEHALLYGIQRPLQTDLAQKGRPTRVLISYGDQWFEWYMRRLAERPANVWFVMKNLRP